MGEILEGRMARALERRRVLVVEDEYFLADDIASALREMGAEVIGPLGSADEGLAALGDRGVDAAVLDVNLGGDERVFPLAEVLRARGIPFVFGTGYEGAVLPPQYWDIPRWQKPFDPQALAEALPGLLKG